MLTEDIAQLPTTASLLPLRLLRRAMEIGIMGAEADIAADWGTHARIKTQALVQMPLLQPQP